MLVYNIDTMDTIEPTINISKQVKGIAAELVASSYFVQRGYQVSVPVSKFGEYDLILDDGHSLSRVQVKTVYWDNSKKRYLLSCVTSHIRKSPEKNRNKKYTLTSFDWLVGICLDTGHIYQIPISKIAGRRSITVYPITQPEDKGNFEQYRMGLYQQ